MKPRSAYPRPLTIFIDFDSYDPELRRRVFEDYRFAACYAWSLLDGDMDSLHHVFWELKGLERDGSTFVLKTPGDLPHVAHIFGMTCQLPMDLIGDVDRWEVSFSRFDGWDRCTINGIPIALLGSDCCKPGPLPKQDSPIAVAWCAVESLNGLVTSRQVTALTIQSLSEEPLDLAPVLQDCPELKELTLICKGVRSMPDGLLPVSLDSLTMPFPQGTETLDFLRHLKGLKTLNLRRCEPLMTLQALRELNEIQDLTIINAPHMRTLEAVKNLATLKFLNLTGARSVVDLTPLSDLPIRHLTLTGCASIESLWSIAALPLGWLDLEGCHAVSDFRPIYGLQRFAHVTMPAG